MPTDPVLLAALRAAPRRHRMPPLPPDAGAARAAGAEAALAFAIEAVRRGQHGHAPPAPETKDLFTEALAAFIRDALAPQGGDPSFQALVLQARDPDVAEHVRLAAQAPADRRAVLSAADTLAHPGKLRGAPPGAWRDALAQLHALATAGDWTALRDHLAGLLAQPLDDSLRPPIEALAAGAALQRLLRADALARLEAVRHYGALCEQRGPLAGSHAATAQGRASARLGEDAEAATVEAFGRIAELLEARGPGHRVLRGLRTPRGFPGAAAKAKEEWDAAIVRGTELLLLAEVKASPAAATPDFARLLRGLQRLAQAAGGGTCAFASADGEVFVSAASLRRLQPQGHALPPHVVYCCSAPAEARPALLGAASKAGLAAEPASLAFAQRLSAGEAPAPAELAPVWEALATEPRLRATLHQYETACAVREAILHPQDLLASVAQALGQPTPDHRPGDGPG